MKNTTTSNVRNHKSRAGADIAPTPAGTLPPQIMLKENGFAAHRAKCQALQDQRADALLNSLEIVFEYTERGHIGIGYNQNGLLVEFCIPRAGGQEDIYNTHWLQTISLADSVEWVRQMEFASRRLDMCCQQDGDGYLRWLRDIRAAIPA